MRATRKTLRHLEATVASAAEIAGTARLEAIAARLTACDAALLQLNDRARAALASIAASAQELRLPQAMLALRTAGAALRLLLSGR